MLADEAASTSWVAPAHAARRHNPVPPDPHSIAAGRTLYSDQCLCCHGSSGKGDGPSSSDLNPKPDDLTTSALRVQTDGAIFWKITSGLDPMPGFDSQLSDKDRWNVVNFIRTLEPKPTTVSSTRQAGESRHG